MKGEKHYGTVPVPCQQFKKVLNDKKLNFWENVA